jgi:hypothetical protein
VTLEINKSYMISLSAPSPSPPVDLVVEEEDAMEVGMSSRVRITTGGMQDSLTLVSPIHPFNLLSASILNHPQCNFHSIQHLSSMVVVVELATTNNRLSGDPIFLKVTDKGEINRNISNLRLRSVKLTLRSSRKR